MPKLRAEMQFHLGERALLKPKQIFLNAVIVYCLIGHVEEPQIPIYHRRDIGPKLTNNIRT